VLDEHGELVAETAVPADGDGLRGLAQRLAGRGVRAVIESMNGARFVHDTLEEHGWEVLIADAQRVKGLAPLACSVSVCLDASLGPSIRRARLASSVAGGAIENRIREQGSADRTTVGAYRHRKTPQTRGFSEERRTRLELATLSLGSGRTIAWLSPLPGRWDQNGTRSAHPMALLTRAALRSSGCT
jgi:hypothetical protein